MLILCCASCKAPPPPLTTQLEQTLLNLSKVITDLAFLASALTLHPLGVHKYTTPPSVSSTNSCHSRSRPLAEQQDMPPRPILAAVLICLFGACPPPLPLLLLLLLLLIPLLPPTYSPSWQVCPQVPSCLMQHRKTRSILMKESLGSGPTDLGENKHYTALLMGVQHGWLLKIGLHP